MPGRRQWLTGEGCCDRDKQEITESTASPRQVQAGPRSVLEDSVPLSGQFRGSQNLWAYNARKVFLDHKGQSKFPFSVLSPSLPAAVFIFSVSLSLGLTLSVGTSPFGTQLLEL